MAARVRAIGRLPVLPAVSIALVLGVVLLVTAAVVSLVDEPQHRGGPLRDPTPPAGAAPIGSVDGLTTFRGNATRTFHGEGPVPLDPVIGWRVPDRPMCSISFVGIDPSRWCGTGWTGQPNVIVGDGGVEVREGAYDGRYHFLDGATGDEVRPPLATRDLAKGSATSDPDGYPLYYAGSRDGRLRVIAVELGQDPEVLWSINGATSVPRPLRNDDWDGAPLVVNDVMFVGGENGWLYVVRLNRDYDRSDQVTVDPEIVATVPGFDRALLRALGDQEVSIENSVALFDGVLYFANSGGLVQGWDVSEVLAGGDRIGERVFRFWTGDDTDATIVIDRAGDLYIASEYQRGSDRSREVGQLMKLDPSRRDPLVWSIDATEIGFEGAGGSWSTPALYADLVIFTTAAGRVLAVDRATGDVRWERRVGSPSIGSPVVVDGVLIQGDCRGDLWAWDVSVPDEDPVLLWRVHFNDCIESTPAVWRGWIYLGTRQGYLYGLKERDA